MKTITVKGILTDFKNGGYQIEDIAKYYGYSPLELEFIGHSINGSVYKLPNGELICEVGGTDNYYNPKTFEYTVKFRKVSKSLKNIDTSDVYRFTKEITEYFNREVR